MDSAKLVLEHVKQLHAFQIAHDPKVRSTVREAFFERARITVKPTKNGLREIGKGKIFENLVKWQQYF